MDQQNHISKKPFFSPLYLLPVYIAHLRTVLISTTSSYFGRQHQTNFLTIGVYMAAMGLGSWLSKYLEDDLLEWFCKIEVLLLGLVGGISVPLLYWFFRPGFKRING
ncbi:MAG: hypothetical protein R2788_18615 [Saprospiraceae bacterium]